MAVELGYYGLCIEDLCDSTTAQKLTSSNPIKIWSRKTLGGTINQVREAIGRHRRSYHLISILAKEPNLAKWAVRDQRVDSILVPLQSVGKVIDSTMAKMVAVHRKALEIRLQEILSAIASRKMFLLRGLQKAIRRVQQRSSLIIVGSGASKQFHLRAPRDVAALLIVIGLDYPDALGTISNTPLTILQENEQRLSPDFIVPGVTVSQSQEGR